MTSLILSEIKKIKLNSNENFMVFEKYYKDFYDTKIRNLKLKIYNPNIIRKAHKNRSYNYCGKIYNEILTEVSLELNKLHDCNLSVKSWEIVFGNWLRYFIWICYERYTSITKTINHNKIKNIFVKENTSFIFASEDTSGIYENSINDNWNSNLYYKILRYLNINNLKVSNYSLAESQKKKYQPKKKIGLKRKIFNVILNVLSLIKFKNSGIVINTFLPLFHEKLFELLLFQIPRNWNFQNVKFKQYDNKKRESFNLNYEKKSSVENFIRKNIKFFLPISVVESFDDIMKISQSMGFPKNPKFIFTSNDFEYNEIFKSYVAKLIERKKINYYIGQHGVYFSDVRGDKFRTEFSTSDKFLTWGYTDSDKFIQSFNFPSFGRKKYYRTNKKHNKLLIVVSPMEYKIYPFYTTHYLENGLENVVEILKSSNKQITKNAIIRLHESYKVKRGEYFLKKYFHKKSLNIDFGSESFHKARQSSRLTLFNYDSTGILENLSLNYPTICMWDDFENNISDKFKDKYKILIDAKILFIKRDDLIKHLNKIWDNIDKWWFDRKTQSYIKKFNQNFNIQGNLSSLINLKKICLK